MLVKQQHNQSNDLRSASQRLLVILRYRLSTYGRRAFAEANGLELSPR